MYLSVLFKFLCLSFKISLIVIVIRDNLIITIFLWNYNELCYSGLNKTIKKKVIWSQTAYNFLNDYKRVPYTVNPSLWESTYNNHTYGLFEVCEGIYQVRGYDKTNLTLIAGDTSWDHPLMSVKCTQAAMELVNNKEKMI